VTDNDGVGSYRGLSHLLGASLHKDTLRHGVTTFFHNPLDLITPYMYRLLAIEL
jgi:hypothetical protein